MKNPTKGIEHPRQKCRLRVHGMDRTVSVHGDGDGTVRFGFESTAGTGRQRRADLDSGYGRLRSLGVGLWYSLKST